MKISERSIKILWSAAGGRCSFENCWTRLCFPDSGDFGAQVIGEMAHIKGAKPTSNRYDPEQTEAARHDYLNLFLVCPTCHTRIDHKENEARFSVRVLEEMKKEHEARVLSLLERNSILSKAHLAKEILMYLEENRHSWAQFGPTSELARKHPFDQNAHNVWLNERLSVIVPNNRRINRLLDKHKSLFDAKDMQTIFAFLIHFRTYEQWVHGEVQYNVVKRFPLEFDELIRAHADASA